MKLKRILVVLLTLSIIGCNTFSGEFKYLTDEEIYNYNNDKILPGTFGLEIIEEGYYGNFVFIEGELYSGNQGTAWGDFQCFYDREKGWINGRSDGTGGCSEAIVPATRGSLRDYLLTHNLDECGASYTNCYNIRFATMPVEIPDEGYIEIRLNGNIIFRAVRRDTTMIQEDNLGLGSIRKVQEKINSGEFISCRDDFIPSVDSFSPCYIIRGVNVKDLPDKFRVRWETTRQSSGGSSWNINEEYVVDNKKIAEGRIDKIFYPSGRRYDENGSYWVETEPVEIICEYNINATSDTCPFLNLSRFMFDYYAGLQSDVMIEDLA